MNRYLASHVAGLPPSGIRKFFDLVATMKDVISLGVGEPDFVTPWTVRESGIFSLEQGQTMYTSNAGLLELREELSHHLSKTLGLCYDPATEILITAGASEAVDLVMRAVLEPGDVVLVPDPSYVSYAPCAILAGASVRYIPTHAKEDFRLRVEDLNEVYTPKAKLLVLSYPNNPTGAIMRREDLIPIADFVAKHDLLVLADDIYSDLTYEGRHVSFASLPGMHDRTLFVSGFSKSYAMTGWRIGYVAGHADLISGLTKIHQYTMLCAPITGQFAALEALRSASEAKDEMVTAYDSATSPHGSRFPADGARLFRTLRCLLCLSRYFENKFILRNVCRRTLKGRKSSCRSRDRFWPFWRRIYSLFLCLFHRATSGSSHTDYELCGAQVEQSLELQETANKQAHRSFRSACLLFVTINC